MNSSRLAIAFAISLAITQPLRAAENPKSSPAAALRKTPTTAPSTQKLPPTQFMHVRQNATSMVILIDGSGSMLPTLPQIKEELRHSVDALLPTQSINIIFFKEDSYVSLAKSEIEAVPLNKLKAYDFIDNAMIHSASDPTKGLKAAFVGQPQVIYLLTNGDFPNNEKVLTHLRTLNKDKKTIINTIAYLEHGEEYEKFLKRVAEENGGKFTSVSRSDLDK